MVSEPQLADPLIRKMMAFSELSEDDCRTLHDLVRQPRWVEPRTDLITEGDKPSNVLLVLEGFACRYKTLPNGRRQIMAYLVPGDFCDLHVYLLNEMDHSLGTLSRCSVVDLPRERILALLERPAVARAFWVTALVDAATLREWLVNVGARPAEERVAHLLCELLFRLTAVGAVSDYTYDLPLTQEELADTMGMSTVHMNRTLQKLRADKLISLRSGKLRVLDFDHLAAFSGFNPNYLHLTQRASAPALET